MWSFTLLRMKRLETTEGLEVSLATTYYGRFLLNHLLLNEVPVYQPARIIHITAAGFPPGKNFRPNFRLLPMRAVSPVTTSGRLPMIFTG